MEEQHSFIGQLIVEFADLAWGMPLLILLLGGGLFFVVYSGLLPYRYFGHAIQILRGKYDNPDDPGDIGHYQALSTALAATVGMGNISGVAVAISIGGPGAVFWMWISALVGVATKFFTCTLAIMYRGKDSAGDLQGGPMYVIMEGLGHKWRPLAVLFSVAGLIGCLPIFQANQLTQTIQDVVLLPAGIENSVISRTLVGLGIAVVVGVVILGGIKRIGATAARMVPAMVVIYFLAVSYILLSNFSQIDDAFLLIFRDAFSGEAASGGLVGAVILAGTRRAAFSNEAGIGTAPMAHGAAKTTEPVREGMIAMLGPVIDTIVVCTLTVLAIIITGTWQNQEAEGISMTLQAFEQGIPLIGKWVLTLCVSVFAITTLFSYSYYGTKCAGFLFGADKQNLYRYFYIASILIGAAASLKVIMSAIDGSFALMAIPTVLSALLLSPKVKAAIKDYVLRMKKANIL